jgi:hypothetical protein
LVIRPTKATDRPGYLELFCNEEGRRYLGGALDSNEVDAAMPAVPGDRVGVFAVELAGELIGMVDTSWMNGGQCVSLRVPNLVGWQGEAHECRNDAAGR